MITSADLAELIRRKLPDALVSASDLTGTLDHYQVEVRSGQFAGMAPLDRHRLIYAAVDAALKDGRLHAIQIKTESLPSR
jgi:stress-induced morphogen